MGVVILRVKDADGEKTIEQDSTGRLELITEYDRHFVIEAFVKGFARDHRVSLSHPMPPMVQGGLPSLGKRHRH
jgi:hypothetical protein